MVDEQEIYNDYFYGQHQLCQTTMFPSNTISTHFQQHISIIQCSSLSDQHPYQSSPVESQRTFSKQQKLSDPKKTSKIQLPIRTSKRYNYDLTNLKYRKLATYMSICPNKLDNSLQITNFVHPYNRVQQNMHYVRLQPTCIFFWFAHVQITQSEIDIFHIDNTCTRGNKKDKEKL